MDNNKINDSLVSIYQTLKFTAKEIEEALDGLAKVQQMAISTELLKSLTKEEITLVNGSLQKTEAEKSVLIEQIAKDHVTDQDFRDRAEIAVRRELNEHLAYLKTRGDENQRSAIAAIAAGIE
jgi:hypothetical protein